MHHEKFIFDSVDFNDGTGEAMLRYSLDDEIHFEEKVTIPMPDRFDISHESFKKILFGLHMIGGISYYKTCLPKQIEIRSGSLTKDDADFWTSVYENGLGEFFYRNEIDPKGVINFPVKGDASSPLSVTPSSVPRRVLVPIGGGKDSMLTIELLRKAGFNITLLRMGGHPAIDALVKKTGLPVLTIKRQLSPQLFKLNEQGALNGHVPITGYLSFVALLTAHLHNFDAVVMSNEHSSSYGNVEYKGRTINHQWSKGLEFERMLQEHVKDSIGSPIAIFSLLRPFTELHISRMFTQLTQYLPLATSCNKNWKIQEKSTHQGLWCGTCPKCAFVFVMFAAFLPKNDLIKIFGKNLFEDASLIPLYKELLGIDGFKPFECVGTPEETLAAFVLAHERGDLNDTPVMQMATEEADMPDDMHALVTAQFTPSEDHAIPQDFLKALPL